jgi:hypothetical protein
MEPNFYQKRFHEETHQANHNQLYLHSHDKLYAQCIPYHDGFVAFPFQREILLFFLEGLGISIKDNHLINQVALFLLIQSFRYILKPFVAFQNDVHQSYVFLIE